MITLVGGAGDRVGGGDCWDDRAEQVSQVQSLFSLILGCIYDSRTFRVHPSRASGALVAHSSTLTLRVHTGQGYFVGRPGFRYTLPDICRRFRWVSASGPVVVVAAL